MKIFFDALNKVINKLYTGNERIIMAGDFNEFYEESNGNFKVDTIELYNKVELHLKQRSNTCCGSTNVKRVGGLFDGSRMNTEDRPFDLFYDSNPVGSTVRVGSNRMSDHLPISANITV